MNTPTLNSEIKKFRKLFYEAEQEALAIPTPWMEKAFPGWKNG